MPEISRPTSRTMSLADLQPADYNPRADLQPGDPDYENIKTSIETYGLIDDLVFNEQTGNLVGGHQRLKVLQQMGVESVEVKVVDLSPGMERSLNLMLNKAVGRWDDEKLVALVDELGTMEDAGPTGWADDELAPIRSRLDIENENNEIDEPDLPGLPDDPITKHGDLYKLGGHALMCGDCREADDAKRLFRGELFSMAVTSPPYAAQRKYDESTSFKPIPPDQYVEWFCAVQENIATNMKEDGSWFVNIKEHCEDGQRVLYVKDLTLAHVREWGWLFVDEFIWTHGGTPKAVRQRFKNGWEPIFQFTRGRHKFRPDAVMHKTDSTVDWKGQHPSQNDGSGLSIKGKSSADLQGKCDALAVAKRSGHVIRTKKYTPEIQGEKGQTTIAPDVLMAYPSNVISPGKNKEALGHAAAFPVGLPEFFIKAYTDENDTVYDPFMGSGTTLIAAEKLGRKCFGMEISPAYCDVTVQRWEALTGKKATREEAE